MASQGLASYCALHVAPKRIATLGDIGDTEAVTRGIQPVQPCDNVLEERQCFGSVAIPVRRGQIRVVGNQERICRVGEYVLNER